MGDRRKADRDWLEGKLFHRPQGSSWQQGRIAHRINSISDHYLIELFSWLDGSVTMAVASVASMTDWKLYDHNEGRGVWLETGKQLAAQTAESA
jgi:hypothetical protein